MSLKNIDNVSVEKIWDKSDLYTAAIYDTEWTWYYMNPVNSVDYKTSATNHFWMYFFGLYDQSSLNRINQPYSFGGLNNTAYADLIDAFETSGAYVFSINQSQFRTEFNGYNFSMSIPLDSSYTGMTSGLTATTLYSSFIYTPDALKKSDNSLCAGVNADMWTSEPNVNYTDKLGFGFKFAPGVNPDPSDTLYPYYSSKIVALVTDDVYYTFTGSTGTSISWSQGYGMDNKYGRFGARMIGARAGDTTSTWNGVGYDRIVGLFNITSGMGVIFSPELVNALDTTQFTGDFKTGATPTSSGTTFVTASDIDYSTQLKISVIIPEDSPNATSNPSYIGQNEECDLATDKICLYDGLGNVVAIAQFDEAIPLGKTVPLEFTVAVDSGINTDGIFTRGIIT